MYLALLHEMERFVYGMKKKSMFFYLPSSRKYLRSMYYLPLRRSLGTRLYNTHLPMDFQNISPRYYPRIGDICYLEHGDTLGPRSHRTKCPPVCKWVAAVTGPPPSFSSFHSVCCSTCNHTRCSASESWPCLYPEGPAEIPFCAPRGTTVA